MNQNIIVPDIGDFDSVEIIEVLVKVGDQIKKDDPLVTLESDKSSVEIPSPSSGKITELNVNVGDKVSRGSLLAKLENDLSNIKLKDEIKTKDPILEKKIVKKIVSQNVGPIKDLKKVFTKSTSEEDIDPLETSEWIESLNAIIENDGPARASYLLNKVVSKAYTAGLVLPDTRTTPYINTIPTELEVKSPGDQNIEKKYVLMSDGMRQLWLSKPIKLAVNLGDTLEHLHLQQLCMTWA